MSKLMVKVDDIWVPMEGLKGDTGPLPADESIPDTALVTDGAKTNTAYLMHNRLTKDAEGELISVEDAYAVPPVSLSVDGKSTQVTTTGKNLCPHKRSQWGLIRFSAVGRGKVVASGGTTHYYIAVPLEEGQSVTWHRNLLAQSPGFFRYCSDYPPVIGSTLSGRVTLTNYTVYTMTNDDGTKPCAILCATSNGMPSDAELEQMQAQLEYGTAFTSYEPYSGGAASPRPDWPQEIASVDELAVTFARKNLWGGAKMREDFLAAVPSYTDGVDATHGAYVSGPSLQNTLYLKPIPFEEGKRYTLILALENERGNKQTSILVVYTDRTSQAVTIADDGSYTVVAYQTLANKTVSHITGVNRTATLRVYYDNCGLFEGVRTVAEFQPYSGATATLDFSEEPLRSLPDGTKDELHLTYLRPSSREGWAYYRGEKVKRIQLVDMGTLNWANYYGNRVFFAIVPNMANGYPDALQAMCEIFATWTNSTLAWFGNRAPANAIALQNNLNRVSVNLDPADAYESVAAFKADMSGVFLHCPLATPETIDLGIFELPAMQSGTTHLWSDPSTNLSVTYERDRNIVITNLKAAVTDLATN